MLANIIIAVPHVDYYEAKCSPLFAHLLSLEFQRYWRIISSVLNMVGILFSSIQMTAAHLIVNNNSVKRGFDVDCC